MLKGTVLRVYKELALRPGRRVYCRILAGGEEFLDDRLMEFSFDDITHPDWFTVGTACANRFHFIAKFSGEIEVNAEVLPYVSFDGEEWCPLGIFYVSRRYVREDVISITAYDRMYSLDMEYSFTGTLPTDSAAILRDICGAQGIEAEDLGISYKVTKIPECCTVRDMIGYIAGLNRACAKFDRAGRLLLKKCNEYDHHVSYLNCMDIQRNMTRSYITALTAETEEGTLTAGSGAETATLEMYNPLMTQEILDSLHSQLKPFSFYGADIEMQGLPFLESGELIYLLDGAVIYPIVVSEIEFFYNGGLTAKLYSRNKTNIDALVREDDLEEALDKLKAALTAMSMKQVNEDRIVLRSSPQIIAEFEFEAASEAFAELNISLGISESTADRAEFKFYINGTESGRVTEHSPSGGKELLHLYHLEQGLPAGKNRIYVTAQTGTGEAYVLPKAMLAGLVVHGAIAQPSSSVRDKVLLFEAFGPLAAVPPMIAFAEIAEQLDCSNVQETEETQ